VLGFYDIKNDDPMGDWCIKTEIENIDKETALRILFGENPDEYDKKLIEYHDDIFEIDEEEAFKDFAMQDFNVRVEESYGVRYLRSE
jgi:hypothetical protein